MAVSLGTIKIDLIANTVSFSNAMTKAEQISLNSAKNIQRSFNIMSLAATTMAASVLASFTAATLKAQHYALEMSRFAEKTGTSVEMMSKLAFSARNAGVPIDMLKGAMERLARTAGNAMGGQAQAIQAYDALGISVKDLHGPLSDSGELLIEISKKLVTMKESTLKNRIEQQLLGRTGSELNPMLLQMAHGFGEMSEAAKRYGIIIDEVGAERAKRFNETLNALKSVMLGLEVRLLNGVSPALVEVGQKIVALVTSSNGMRYITTIADALAKGIRMAGNAFEYLWNHASAVKKILEALAITKLSSIFLQIGMSAVKGGTGVGTIVGALGSMIGKMTGANLLLSVFSSALKVLAINTIKQVTLAWDLFGLSVTQNTTVALAAIARMKQAISGISFAGLSSLVTSTQTSISNAISIATSALRSLGTTAVTSAAAGLKQVVVAARALQQVNLAGLAQSIASDITGALRTAQFAVRDVGVIAEVVADHSLNKLRLTIISLQGISLSGLATSIGGSLKTAANATAFAIRDIGVVASVAASVGIGKLQTALLSLQQISLSGLAMSIGGSIKTAANAAYFALMDLGIVAGVVANKGLDKIRLAFIALQQINIAPVMARAGAAIASFATTASASIYAVTVALWEMAAAALLNPLTWIVGGIAAITAGVIALYKFRDATVSIGGEAFHLRDTWNAAWLAIKDGFSVVGKAIKNIWTSVMEWLESTSIGGWIKTQIDRLVSFAKGIHIPVPAGIMTYLEAAKNEREGTPLDKKPSAPGLPTGIAGQNTVTELTDAPVLNTHLGATPSDPVAKKMLDLKLAADAAKKALADAGKGVDFKRANEITAEYDKTVAELNLELARHGKHLSDTQKAQIKSDIATKVNAESQAKFREELVNTTRELLDQASAMEIHAQMAGRSANEIREAAIKANAAKLDADKSAEWMAANRDLIMKRDVAFGKQFDANNADQDAGKISDLKVQIALQTALNAAIGKGKDAQDAVALANEQAQIRADFAKRGDTDQQRLQTALETNKELFDLKQKQALLDKAAGFNPAQAYQDQTKELNDMVAAAREAGIAINDMQVAGARKGMWDDYQKSLDEITLKVGTMKDGFSTFFKQMTRDSKSAAQQVYDVMSTTISSLNSTLVNLMTGQKASFSDFFRGIAGQLANLGLQKIESGIMESIFGKEDDPTTAAVNTSNGYLASIDASLASMAGRSSIPGVSSPLGNGGILSSVGGGVLSKIAKHIPGGNFLGSLFGGHRALGGDVKAGMTYDVGELGRERFTPSMDGKITPNKDLKGGSPIFHIDAKGAHDPAQTEAAVYRALGQVMPQILSGSLAAASEQRRRSPLSSSR